MSKKSSGRWKARQSRDPYVKQAKAHGYVSRAAFKLLELNQKERILKPGMVVIDLGAAPGGWSQVVLEKIGASGLLIATDILPMPELPETSTIQGDITDPAIREQIVAALGGRQVDLVISDIAPNLSGIADVDQAKSVTLAEVALDFALELLAKNGVFLVKIFQGADTQAFLDELKSSFVQVKRCKPKASRDESREIYALARKLALV